MINEMLTGDFLFAPQKNETYSKSDDHLALVGLNDPDDRASAVFPKRLRKERHRLSCSLHLTAEILRQDRHDAAHQRPEALPADGSAAEDVDEGHKGTSSTWWRQSCSRSS